MILFIISCVCIYHLTIFLYYEKNIDRLNKLNSILDSNDIITISEFSNKNIMFLYNKNTFAFNERFQSINLEILKDWLKETKFQKLSVERFSSIYLYFESDHQLKLK